MSDVCRYIWYTSGFTNMKVELHTTKSRYFDFLASCAILSKNHQFLRVENFVEIFSFLSNSRMNHKIEIVSYRVPKRTNRKNFVHTFTFLNPEVCQRYLHTSEVFFIIFSVSQHIDKVLLLSPFSEGVVKNEIDFLG